MALGRAARQPHEEKNFRRSSVAGRFEGIAIVKFATTLAEMRPKKKPCKRIDWAAKVLAIPGQMVTCRQALQNAGFSEEEAADRTLQKQAQRLMKEYQKKQGPPITVRKGEEAPLSPLFPDAKDEDGKRVIIKIDSGPGRANMQLLAKLKLLGIILYPGVPNTTSVTQETDQSYGLFKSIFRQNLEDIVNDRIDNRNASSVSPWEIGLLVFGGKDRVTGKEGYRNAFSEAFSVDKNKEAWAKVGAAFRIIHTEKPTSRLTAAELETLLAWHGVAKSKMGKKVEDKRQKWMEIKSKGTGPPQYEKWTEADEEELSRLKSCEVSMADTAVGRERENCKRLFKATFKSMSEEDKRKCMEELNAELNNDANNDST